MREYLYTIYVFSKINTRRFFRNRVAIFFGVLFPLVILFVLGGLFGNSGSSISFNVALINESTSTIATAFATEAASSTVLSVDPSITTLADADVALERGSLDAAIVLPPSFGTIAEGSTTPSGEAAVYTTHNDAQAGQALATLLKAQFEPLNAQYVTTQMPFTVATKETGQRGLTSFDYTFAGLLGFALLGIGIFGPANVFPELKRLGVLRRLHTTPLTVAQYFISTAISQAATGLITIIAMFAAGILVFHLQVVGNYLELIAFLLLSIAMMLGIGLALGGWAKDQSQAAPLSNIIVFPMMFLSGTFFPRFLMPGWVQAISAYFPLTPVIDGLRMIATEGKSLVEIAPQLGLVCMWLVVIYVIAFRVFRWN
ncbi:MAG TPA: ABC transporter permease [Candidatus Paceibacterota bacterium]|nr:ABC transporter permease [Candidatus Paceibacterota bacterium]